MASQAGRDAYLAQLQALLPRGRAWPRHAGARLTALLTALAEALAAADLKGVQLIRDINPATTSDLASDWERIMGLPDECSEAASGLASRRAAIIEKLVARVDLNPQTFIDLARTFGITISIDEHDRSRADLIAGLDTAGGRWRHVWWITISADSSRFKSVLDDVNTPLLDFEVSPEFACRLKQLTPAHTHLQIEVSLS